jgi:prepilin signal peptidase PulO-like enzyme (type II secretory pathway)
MAVGAALGLIDVAIAAVAGFMAVSTQLAASVLLRRRIMPFAPALLVGTVVAALLTTWGLVTPARFP